uniref:Uncharacterized protein n=1 Tax=Rhizophora mucronata TaxID=61149 RepID=A0A2P2N3V5_RHIMU
MQIQKLCATVSKGKIKYRLKKQRKKEEEKEKKANNS